VGRHRLVDRRCCVVRSTDVLNPFGRLRSERLGEFVERRSQAHAGLGIEAEFVVSAAQILDEGERRRCIV
ncbi:hypothetical protein, partial [Planosporangium thailandense]|uniref:hypothetical protein n=1 Tax=Planosporangium thailandense TaxID=765197 RepID=UPI00197BAD2F